MAMNRSKPLPNTNPEFTVLAFPGFFEYRVENWHLARDGSGRTVSGTSGWTWRDGVIPVIVSFLWPKICDSLWALIGLGLLSVLLLWFKCTQVLYESVLVLPPHGVQLETHYGFPLLPLMAKRRFIPMTSLQDFIIIEGLRRWNVRYYLAAVKRSGPDAFSLETAYENILPHFPVLVEVYRGVQESMFTPVANVPGDDAT